MGTLMSPTESRTTAVTTDPSKPPKRIFYGWWILLASVGSSTLNSTFYMIGMGTFFLPVAESFNTSKTALSGAFSLARLESGLLGPVQGFLVDRLGSRTVMLVGVTMMGAGFILISLAPSLLFFYIFFVLFIALGQSFGLGPPVTATVINWFVKYRARALALTLSGSAIGGLLVPVLAWSIRAYGWEKAAFVSGLIIWAVGYPIALTMRYRPEDHGFHPDDRAPEETAGGVGSALEEEPYFTPKEALRTVAFWIMGLAFGLRMLSSAGVPIHLVAYFEEDVGFSSAKAALFLGLIGTAGLGGRLVFGVLGDALTKRYVLFGAIVIQAVSLPILAMVDGTWMAVLFLLLFATGHAGGAPAMLASRGEYFGRRFYATIAGFMATLMLMGTVAGPLAAAVLSDRFDNGYQITWYLYGGLSGVSAVLLLLLRPPTPKARRSQ